MADLTINLKPKRRRQIVTPPRRGPLERRDEPEYLPRRKTGIYLNFWDLGQVWNGSAWEDLDFVASPPMTEDNTGSDPPRLDTVDSLDSSHWTAYKNKIFEVPLEDWTTTYRQVSYEDGFRYGFDIYTGDPSLVNPANQPNHLDLDKYYPVATDWQRPPVDYYLQGDRRGIKLNADASVGSTTILAQSKFPNLTILAGTKLCFSRTHIVVVQVDVTVTGAGNTPISISPLSVDVENGQNAHIYPDTLFTNRSSWTPQGLRIQPSEHFNLITFNAFMNIGLYFTPHITAVNDSGAASVPFSLTRSTDFFLVPALTGNEHIGAWHSIGPMLWDRNSYLNYDYRPWSRQHFLTNDYFETTLPDSFNTPSFAPVDCPVFAKGDYTFWYEYNGLETIPLPDEWDDILNYYKNATDARQFKEGGGVGEAATADFAVAPEAQLWLASFSAINERDILPDSFGYVTPGSLLAVAKQGSDYFYFWYNGAQKINNQYSLSASDMQTLQFEYNYVDL